MCREIFTGRCRRCLEVVTVYILPEQCHFPVSLLKQLPAFIEDTFRIAASLTSSRKGNYTEGAHIVAATHDAHKRGDAVAIDTERRDIGIGFFPAQQHIDPFLSAMCLFHQSG